MSRFLRATGWRRLIATAERGSGLLVLELRRENLLLGSEHFGPKG